MKMTWKNTCDSKSKIRKRPNSFNPNLPFEDLNFSSDTKEEGESLRNADVSIQKPTAFPGEEDGERKNLARDFEAQRNKLAEFPHLEMAGTYVRFINLLKLELTLDWRLAFYPKVPRK